MRIVVAECTVDYDGRLTAHLPMATRLVMVKADGCVAVHADGGAYKPLDEDGQCAPHTLQSRSRSRPHSCAGLFDPVRLRPPGLGNDPGRGHRN